MKTVGTGYPNINRLAHKLAREHDRKELRVYLYPDYMSTNRGTIFASNGGLGPNSWFRAPISLRCGNPPCIDLHLSGEYLRDKWTLLHEWGHFADWLLRGDLLKPGPEAEVRANIFAIRRGGIPRASAEENVIAALDRIGIVGQKRTRLLVNYPDAHRQTHRQPKQP